MKKSLAALVLLVLMAGCSHVDNYLTEPQVVYRDVDVRKSNLAVYMKPARKHPQALTAMFYPFFISQQAMYHYHLGQEFGRLFHSNWTAKGIFPTLAFDEQIDALHPDRAILDARMRGADLAVLGTVPYFYYGSSLDDTAITIRLKIYDVSSGRLLWDMEQAARIDARMPKDWVIIEERFRMTDSPLYRTVNSIADDMALPIRSWLPNPGFAGSSPQIVQNLTAPQDGPRVEAMSDEEMARVFEDTPLAESETVVTPPRQDDDNGAEPGKSNANAAANDMEQELGDQTSDGGMVNLKVRFDVDRATIRPESNPILDELAKALQSPELKGNKVVIAGHTDSTASAEYNMDLSRRRAAAVKRYLVEKHGIAPSLIRTEGYGEARPVATNDTPEGRQLNRRVEVRLDE